MGGTINLGERNVKITVDMSLLLTPLRISLCGKWYGMCEEITRRLSSFLSFVSNRTYEIELPDVHRGDEGFSAASSEVGEVSFVCDYGRFKIEIVNGPKSLNILGSPVFNGDFVLDRDQLLGLPDDSKVTFIANTLVFEDDILVMELVTSGLINVGIKGDSRGSTK